jgi:hypothetical protein
MTEPAAMPAAQTTAAASSAPPVATPSPPRSALFARAADLAAALYLAALIAFALYHMWSSLFRVWFFSSDEYVFAAEAIRFLNLDFRQHFFDMPGTPLMFLASGIWSLVHVVQGGGPAQLGLNDFTFEHLPNLFILMRGITLVFYCASVVLMFVVASRLLNRAAGWVAALILAMSGIYTSYSSFVRVESLSICLILLAILILLRVTQRQAVSATPVSTALFDGVLVAGMLAGLAAANRLHSVTASLPALVLILVLQPAPRTGYPKWARVLLAAAAAGIGVALLLVLATGQTIFLPYPHARRLFATALVAGAATLALGALLYRVPRLQPTLCRIASPAVIRLLFGCAVGFLLGTPTVVPQYAYFFSSIEMYSSGYRDLARASMPFWEHLKWYVGYYVRVAAGDTVVLALVILGALVILLRRDRRALPFLAGALLFFVSKPLSVVPAAHHVMLWLPYVAIVCSYPVAVAWNAVARVPRYGVPLATALFLVLFPPLWQSLTKGPEQVALGTALNEERLANVLKATEWMRRHTEPNATIAISYFCFNPDVFYRWLVEYGVPVPKSVLAGREYLIWWGHARALGGKTGYVCATRHDVVSIKTNLDLAEPGQGTDPFTDKRFELVQSFGTGLGEVDVFRFDYRR